MRAGLLKHRITIEQPADAATAPGGTEWPGTTFASRRAQITTGGGKEFSQAQSIHGELSHLIIMPGRCAVTNSMRVVFDGRYFEILAAWSPDGKSCDKAAEIHMACREML